MKKLAILSLILLLSGCATFALPNDATNAEKRAAMCADGKAGLLMADAGISVAASDEVKVYWYAFKIGAELAIASYCDPHK